MFNLQIYDRNMYRFMILLYVFIISFYAVDISFSHNYEYEKKVKWGIVNRVVDGDTIAAIVEGQYEKIRLLFIDAMESRNNPKFRRDLDYYKENNIMIEKKDLIELGKQAAYYLRSRLPAGSIIKLEIIDGKERDRYNRILALIYYNNININLELVAKGYARTYFIGYTPEKEKDEFLIIENEARHKNLGIWRVLK